jgi:hypothetical protein
MFKKSAHRSTVLPMVWNGNGSNCRPSQSALEFESALQNEKMSKEIIDPLEQARKSVQQDLAWISSDNFDASFRDSIVLCSHILDTHQVGILHLCAFSILFGLFFFTFS